MKRLRVSLAREHGFAMVTVMILLTMIGLMAFTLLPAAMGESDRSAHAIWRSASFQAAEAGLDDYVSKLVDDPLYYTHYLHVGESTRRAPNGALVSAGAAWTYQASWSYPALGAPATDKNAWRALDNGYEYNLMITGPSVTSPGVKVVATGRRQGSTRDMRSIEALVRPATVADFQMLANNDISYGSTASTNGKIYAGIDSGGVRHNVTHYGRAYANVYAEGNVYGPPTLLNGARTYNSTTIRNVIKNPINFASFLTSVVDIQLAAQASGVYLNDTSKDGWRLIFRNDGTFTSQTCTKSLGRDIADAIPVCGVATTRAVPSNGAVYVNQSAIVSGVVDGRVTVASGNNIVVAGDISYETSGDDVLGLVGTNEVIVARWVPYNLNWRAGTIAQSGRWRSWVGDGSKGTMTFTGSTATNLGGYMNMFQTRVYNYDDTLLFLPPPWFPVAGDAYTVAIFRELRA